MMLSTPATALVTGGTSGIGYALTQRLLRDGHTVIVAARGESRLQEMQAEHRGLHTYRCDLSSRQQVEELAGTLLANHSQLNLLINNAGVQYTPTLLDEAFSLDSVEREMTINFLAPVWLTSMLLPQLLSQPQAAVVNISSGLAFAPKTNSAIYSASKAALHSFSQTLRYQLEGTTVASLEAIMPLVDTAMTRGRGSGKLTPEYAADKIVNGIGDKVAEIYVGKAQLLPWLLRLSPSLVKNILKKY